MAPAHWTEKNHKIIIGIMTAIILIFFGMYFKDLNIGSKVRANEQGITANTTEIEHVKETHIEKLDRIEEIQKVQGNKIDDIKTAVTAIQTIIENQ